MTMLQQIHRGRRHNPPRLLIYGTEGIGKSTTAAAAPRPIFVPTEDGLDQIECASFPLATRLADVDAALRTLIQEKHDFETVVIDSADWLERLVWDALCEQYGVNSIEKVDGGYAKGYTHALTHWRKLLGDLNTLRNQRGMCVIVLAHAKVEKFEDPEFSAYDRYSPRLHKHVTALLTEWSDAVLFATRKIITKTEDGGFGRERTIAAGLGKDGGERQADGPDRGGRGGGGDADRRARHRRDDPGGHVPWGDIWRIAGSVGVDPCPLTLRQLLWMAEGLGRERWAHTSMLCALVANANRDPKRTRPFKPADFDPYARQDRRERVIVDEESLAMLKEAFTGRKGNEHGQ